MEGSANRPSTVCGNDNEKIKEYRINAWELPTDPANPESLVDRYYYYKNDVLAHCFPFCNTCG